MTAWLETQGHQVNRKRISRLMEVMGIEAVYPKPKLSQVGAATSSGSWHNRELRSRPGGRNPL
jgi:hypothetical protein